MSSFRAPAKINLYLHVTGWRNDGYHLLDSLTVFACDIADELALVPARDFSLLINGPFADNGNAGLMQDNLVLRAAREIAREAGRTDGFSITLEKNIPMGAGLGGGSADAAAIVRAVEKAWEIGIPAERRNQILQKLGADVPVCYYGMPARFEGSGEIIHPLRTALPPFHMLLIWPDAHTATKDVFEARTGSFSSAAASMPVFSGFSDFIEWLLQTRNDLGAAAEGISPAITEARIFLAGIKGCALSRMSGSGSSVFGIFEHEKDCAAAREICRGTKPAWWAETTRIG